MGAFVESHAYWLVPYAVFCVLRDLNETADFRTWPVLGAGATRSEVSAFADDNWVRRRSLLIGCLLIDCLFDCLFGWLGCFGGLVDGVLIMPSSTLPAPLAGLTIFAVAGRRFVLVLRPVSPGSADGRGVGLCRRSLGCPKGRSPDRRGPALRGCLDRPPSLPRRL